MFKRAGVIFLATFNTEATNAAGLNIPHFISYYDLLVNSFGVESKYAPIVASLFAFLLVLVWSFTFTMWGGSRFAV